MGFGSTSRSSGIPRTAVELGAQRYRGSPRSRVILVELFLALPRSSLDAHAPGSRPSPCERRRSRHISSVATARGTASLVLATAYLLSARQFPKRTSSRPARLCDHAHPSRPALLEEQRLVVVSLLACRDSARRRHHARPPGLDPRRPRPFVCCRSVSVSHLFVSSSAWAAVRPGLSNGKTDRERARPA